MLLRLLVSDHTHGFHADLIISLFFVDAWLITAGTNVGVVKLVGEALNNYRYKNHKNGLDVPCIGICTWEYTAGTELIENSRPRLSTTDDESTTETVKSRRRSRLGSVALVK